MRKHIVVGVLAVAVLGGSAIALASSSDSRVPATEDARSNPINKRFGKVNRRLNQAHVARVSCGSIACINRSLSRLTTAVNVLKRETYQCEKYVNVTQYSGYLYTPDGGANVFETTALDYTEQGDTATDRVLVYVC